MLNQTYDFVVSIGEDCACAMYLNKFLLRTRSYPFDWLCNAPFETRIDLILNDFNGFLQHDNMRWFPKPTSGLRDMKNENYEDTNTKFYFYHDFRSDVDFKEMFPIVREKYDRRIKRFYEAIANSKNVLFVWWSRDKIIPQETLLDAQRKLSEKFGKNIKLLIFEHLENADLMYENVSESITIARGHLTVPENTTQGNVELCDKVFSRIKRAGTKRVKFLKKFSHIRPIKYFSKKFKNFIVDHCQKY